MRIGSISKDSRGYQVAASLTIVLATCCTLAFGAEKKVPPGAAQAPNSAPTPATPIKSNEEVSLFVESAIAVTSSRSGTESAGATYGSRVRVKIGGLEERIAKDKQFNYRKLILYLDDNAFNGVYVEPVQVRENSVEFVLPDKVLAKDLWKPILKSPPWGGVRDVEVSVGTDDGKERLLPADLAKPPKLSMILFPGYWWVLLIGVAAVGLALCYLAATTSIIRDGSPRPTDTQLLQPYSLALTQAAWWFFWIFAAFVFIWLMTGTFNGVMTANALALMGIGAGTSLGAAMVEAGQSSQVQQRRAELEAELATATANNDAGKMAKLEQLIRPASRDLVQDLLTDKDGITLHRFQMLVWTFALGLIFVVGVYQNLAMPVFDPELLALMGISSGVYLGFKIPEKQA